VSEADSHLAEAYASCNVTYCMEESNGKQRFPEAPWQSWRWMDFGSPQQAHEESACSELPRGNEPGQWKDVKRGFVHDVEDDIEAVPEEEVACEARGVRWHLAGTRRLGYSTPDRSRGQIRLYIMLCEFLMTNNAKDRWNRWCSGRAKLPSCAARYWRTACALHTVVSTRRQKKKKLVFKGKAYELPL
jgi:hypothetical protein